MLIIFRCTVRHNFEPSDWSLEHSLSTQPLVLGSNPSTTNFLAVWRWTLVDGVGGCQALVLACFGAGGWGEGGQASFGAGRSRWVRCMGSPSWCWFLSVLAASVLSVKLIFAH